MITKETLAVALLRLRELDQLPTEALRDEVELALEPLDNGWDGRPLTEYWLYIIRDRNGQEVRQKLS